MILISLTYRTVSDNCKVTRLVEPTIQQLTLAVNDERGMRDALMLWIQESRNKEPNKETLRNH